MIPLHKKLFYQAIGGASGTVIALVCLYFMSKEMYGHAVMSFVLGVSLVHLIVYRFS